MSVYIVTSPNPGQHVMTTIPDLGAAALLQDQTTIRSRILGISRKYTPLGTALP